MKNKTIYFLLALFLLGGVGFFLIPKKQVSSSCPFCNSKILETQKFYEDDEVIALCTHKPVFPGHALIIPKRHVERFEELSASEILKIGETIKKIDLAAREAFDTSSYLLLQKNGKEVGQTVPHVHFHYIPRKANESSSLKFVFRMYWTNLLKPIKASEMEEVVRKFKEAI